jgi:hypothetical protein
VILPSYQPTQHMLANDIHRPPSSMLQFWPILDLQQMHCTWHMSKLSYIAYVTTLERTIVLMEQPTSGFTEGLI